jgi:hypothetical protein
MSEKDEARAEAERRVAASPDTLYYEIDREYVSGFCNGSEWQASRIVALLEGLTAYDKDGDLMLAESWPELRAQIEGVDHE